VCVTFLMSPIVRELSEVVVPNQDRDDLSDVLCEV
jgi:hypothetical protein